MIGTNRDLAAMRQILDCEIARCWTLAKRASGAICVGHRLASLYRQRGAVCATLLNRQAEAENKIVDFSRWVSGNGALAGLDAKPNSGTVNGASQVDRLHGRGSLR